MKDKFISIVKENIKREGVNDLLQWLENSDFFYCPASSRYHLSCENGLLIHSLNVYDCLCNVLKSNNIMEYSQESIALVALMHDICKCNFYVKGFRNVKNEETGKWEKKEVYQIEDQFPLGHGSKSVILLQRFIKLTDDEIYAIVHHMSGWDSASRGGDYSLTQAYEKCKLAVALAIADMSATYFYEDKNNEEESIEILIQTILDLCKEIISKGIDKELVYDIISIENDGKKNPNSIKDINVANKIIVLLKEKLNG